MSDTTKTSSKVPAEKSGDKSAKFKYIKQENWICVEKGTVFSFMPGTVEDIKVKEGDSVRQGDVLIIFRAMKMNNKILSPIDGKVKSINVKKGDNIPKNALMVTVA